MTGFLSIYSFKNKMLLPFQGTLKEIFINMNLFSNTIIVIVSYSIVAYLIYLLIFRMQRRNIGKLLKTTKNTLSFDSVFATYVSAEKDAMINLLFNVVFYIICVKIISFYSTPNNFTTSFLLKLGLMISCLNATLKLIIIHQVTSRFKKVRIDESTDKSMFLKKFYYIESTEKQN